MPSCDPRMGCEAIANGPGSHEEYYFQRKMYEMDSGHDFVSSSSPGGFGSFQCVFHTIFSKDYIKMDGIKEEK